MKLLIDAGNTRCKWALMSDAGELQCDGILDTAQLDAARLPPAFSQADAIWMANVAGEQTLQLLQQMLEPLGLP
ncbi:MAG: type III pantothenate kinase, partial [Methylophilaceae bacterium]